jgi:glycosyltransferase involved in cell wall biosynthesis
MHALVTSPVPSHPQNHGNRARVFSVCRALQSQGYEVHFVYGGLEGLAPEQERAMRDAWDHVYILPRKYISRRRARRRHHLIDDWYPEEITRITRRILDIWDIRICLANYVWFSGWLTHAPAHLPRYIDTHDIFGNRHKALKRDGLAPSWFYTSPKEEAKALARASTVIAIQDEEARVFRKMTDTPVKTLGFFDAPHYLPPLERAEGRRLRVGYIASNNPINQSALARLNQSLAAVPALLDACDFLLAGPICDTEAARNSAFEPLGFVPSVEGFYRDMDVILNPNIGGTGLKIKSVEALRFGRPLLATRDAMIGIPTRHEMHACADTDALCESLGTLASSPAALQALETAGRATYDGYCRTQLETLHALFPAASPRAGGEEP